MQRSPDATGPRGAETFGPYELQSLLGRGGMGEVHRALDTRKGRVVALKRLPVGLVTDTDFRRRFLREAELAARLRDPHVIPIHDYGEIDGQLYLDMRLVDGVDLATHLHEHGPLAPARAVALLGQVGRALDAAHHAGLIHRDVKPQNILLSNPEHASSDDGESDDFAYLIDFGIAANLLASRHSSSFVAGTAAYMAPERFSGQGDHRVDVYALGCALHEAVTGEAPFGGDLMQLMWSHANTPPPRPSATRPDLPVALDAVVAMAMAKEPDRRFQSAGSLVVAARRATAAARQQPPPRPVRQPPRQPSPTTHPAAVPTARAGALESGARAGRRRDTAVLVALAVVAVVGLLVALVVVRPGASPLGPARAADVLIANDPDLQGFALAADGHRLYTTNGKLGESGAGTVSVIDTDAHRKIATVPIGRPAKDIAVAPDGAFVCAATFHSIEVIDARTDTTRKSISPSSSDPRFYTSNSSPFVEGVAVSPDSTRIYASTDDGVIVLDAVTGQAVGLVRMSFAGRLAVSPDGRRVYVASIGTEHVLSVIDTVGASVVATVPMASTVQDLAVTPDGRRVYVSNFDAGLVSVVDTARDSVSATIPTGAYPWGLAVAPDGRRVYTVQGSRLAAIDTSSNTVAASIPSDDVEEFLAIGPDGRHAYSATYPDKVSVIDLGT